MSTERRNHARKNLHVPVFLFPSGSAIPVRAETENIAIDGFFCYCSYPFSPHDHLKFLLTLPHAGDEVKKSNVYLCGEVDVVRISVPAGLPGFGVACHIVAYGVLSDSDSLTLEQALTATLEGKDVNPR